MAKIKVIKSGKEAAKPSNYCPWMIDYGRSCATEVSQLHLRRICAEKLFDCWR